MAQVFGCDGCSNEQAVLLVQNLDTGEPLMFGPRCALDWCEGMTAALQQALGENTPDSAGQAATGELSTGGDTPGATVAESAAGDPATLPAEGNATDEASGGGKSDERIRTSDPGTAGVHPVGAGASGLDDSGADQLGGREGGSGGGGGADAGDGTDAASQRTGDAAGDEPAGSAGLDTAGAGDTGDLASTGLNAGRDLTTGT